MKEKKSILEYKTVSLNFEKKALVILDQTLLPNQKKMLYLTEQKDIWGSYLQTACKRSAGDWDCSGNRIFFGGGTNSNRG